MTDTPNRALAQFFFEVGYGACFAEAMIQNGMKPPFKLTDEHVEAAWPRSIEAHEDAAEMDQRLALANAAPDLLTAAQALGAMPEGYCFCSRDRVGDDSKVHEPECAAMRAAIAKARGAGR